MTRTSEDFTTGPATRTSDDTTTRIFVEIMSLLSKDEADADTHVPFPSHELRAVQEDGDIRECTSTSSYRLPADHGVVLAESQTGD